MQDWEDIVDADEDEEGIILPAPQRTKDSNGLITEVSYAWQDKEIKNNNNNEDLKIIRTERKIHIIRREKKISKSALLRKQTLRKFGMCANLKKGFIEKGVTHLRPDETLFKWEGLKHAKNKQRINPNNMKLINDKTKQLGTEEKKENANMANNNNAIGGKSFLESALSNNRMNNRMNNNNNNRFGAGRKFGSGAYRPPIRSSYPDEDEETFEIRISNLPDSVEYPHVRELIDAFYKNVLKQPYTPRLRIRVFRRRADQEINAIVEFKNLKHGQKAIEYLNGHRYEYHILKVEKSIPRPKRY